MICWRIEKWQLLLRNIRQKQTGLQLQILNNCGWNIYVEHWDKSWILKPPTNSPSFFFFITGVASEGKGTRSTIAGPTAYTEESSRQPAGGFQDWFHWGLHEVSGLHSENTRYAVSSCCRVSSDGSVELRRRDPMIGTNYFLSNLLSLLCFNRLAEENQGDPVGPPTSWYLWLVKNPVSLG